MSVEKIVFTIVVIVKVSELIGNIDSVIKNNPYVMSPVISIDRKVKMNTTNTFAQNNLFLSIGYEKSKMERLPM
jgi:hypothetical protein